MKKSIDVDVTLRPMPTARPRDYGSSLTQMLSRRWSFDIRIPRPVHRMGVPAVFSSGGDAAALKKCIGAATEMV